MIIIRMIGIIVRIITIIRIIIMIIRIIPRKTCVKKIHADSACVKFDASLCGEMRACVKPHFYTHLHFFYALLRHSAAE